MLKPRVSPRPETPVCGIGSPPLITIPIELFPPAVVPGNGVPPPPVAGDPGAPPGTPGFLPSGDRETRAAKFPSGTGTTGAGGAGVAESAISVLAEPTVVFEFDGTTSGAAATSPGCFLASKRGVEPALISSFGLAGPVSCVAKVISAGFVSRFGICGAGVSV